METKREYLLNKRVHQMLRSLSQDGWSVERSNGSLNNVMVYVLHHARNHKYLRVHINNYVITWRTLTDKIIKTEEVR